MLGLNFYKESPRYMSRLMMHWQFVTGCGPRWGPSVRRWWALFVNEVVGTISAITLKVGLGFAQLSGDESDAMLKELRGIGFKAIRPMNLDMALDDVSYFAETMPIGRPCAVALAGCLSSQTVWWYRGAGQCGGGIGGQGAVCLG